LKGEVRVDQSENSPIVLVSSSGWAPESEAAISSENRIVWNLKFLELERLVSRRSTRSYRLEERKNRVRHDGMRRGPLVLLKNAEEIQMVRTWWIGSGVGGDWRRWIRMVTLGGDRWKGLCTEWIILNEVGWQRKWAWNRGTGDYGETILEPRRGNYPHVNHILVGR